MFLAWIPFVHPIDLPDASRLWLFIPLAAIIAVVYRATRAKNASELALPVLRTFVSIVLGMVGLALGAYVLHQIALRTFT